MEEKKGQQTSHASENARDEGGVITAVMG